MKILKSSLLIWTILLLGQTSLAQDLENFTPIQCSGEFPEIFHRNLMDKIEDERDQILDDDDLKRSEAKEFAALTSYSLENLIGSGRILFGDPLTTYAQSVLDRLIEHHDHEDLEDVQLFTLKSPEVNAFATHQGVIFVTVGLLAQIENEAQLAFILAHELSHIDQQHSLEKYQHANELLKGSSSYRKREAAVTSFFNYSKDNEIEADKLGFKLAVKAGYKAEDAMSTFNVLLYSYLPIDEIPYSYEFLESEQFKFPEELYIEEISPISAEEDVDDEYLTHPNIKKRKKKMLRQADKAGSDSSRASYLVHSEEEFMYMRNLARFELNVLYLKYADYIPLMYNTFVLEKDFPNNPFLINSKAMAMYGMAAYTNIGERSTFRVNPKRKEGEIQAAYFFYYELGDEELAILATKYIWEQSLADTSNAFLLTLREKAIRELLDADEMELEEFPTAYLQPEVKDSTAEEDTEELSKYEKIAAKRKKKEESDYIQYAFVELLKDSSFTDAYTRIYEEVTDDDDEDYSFVSTSDKISTSTLDIGSVMMMSPVYMVSDDRKGAYKSVMDNYDNRQGLVDALNESSDLLDIDLTYVDQFKSGSYTTDDYNDFCLLSDYLYERMSYTEEDFIPYFGQYTGDIMDRTGSKHLGYISLYTTVEGKPFEVYTAFLSAITVIPIPFYLYWQFRPYQNSEITFMVLNLETNNLSMFSNRNFNHKLNDGLRDAHMYNLLHQIKLQE